MAQVRPWRVELVGDKFDLQELESLCLPEGTAVQQAAGKYYLRMLDPHGADPQDVLTEGKRLVSAINGVASVYVSGWHHVSVASVSRDEPHGGRSAFVFEVAQARARDFASATLLRDGKEVLQPARRSPAERALELTRVDLAVEKVFRILGNTTRQFRDLYVALEVIEEDAGGMHALLKKNWASETQIKAFKHTANSSSALGDDSRHGRESSDPPRAPTSLRDARSLIARIAKEWISSKTGG